MSASRSLPARPSLESLRKQAKKLARDAAAGDAGAVGRVRAHLPDVDAPLTLRNAQFVIAREYGLAGWHELSAEVSRRIGTGLEWASAQARRVIHDNDVERLKQLIAEYPPLLSWQDEKTPGGILGFATESYGDSFDPVRERQFTRAQCAELLIDAGAVVIPSVCEGLLQSRARGLLQLFRRKGLLPHTLKFLAVFGAVDDVRAALDREGIDTGAVEEAFTIACDFQHETLATFLLDLSIQLDAQLGAKIDASIGRRDFVGYFVDNRPRAGVTPPANLWRAFVMEQVRRAVSSWSGSESSVVSPSGNSDLSGFIRLLDREPWLLEQAFVAFQAEIVERATLKNRPEFITTLLERDPAILRQQPPPASQAIEFAFTYAKAHLIPLLTRIWPLPDDLPHAAGMGNLSRVKGWFDESGAALGDLEHHYPSSPYMPRNRLEESLRERGPLTVQRVLDTAFAWAVINTHLDVADFLLEHGADINTTWSSHEPASILHELVFHANYQSMQFLIDRGIDMTIEDYRWNATARGWALHAAKDEKMADWLEDAQRRRALGT